MPKIEGWACGHKLEWNSKKQISFEKSCTPKGTKSLNLKQLGNLFTTWKTQAPNPVESGSRWGSCSASTEDIFCALLRCDQGGYWRKPRAADRRNVVGRPSPREQSGPQRNILWLRGRQPWRFQNCLRILNDWGPMNGCLPFSPFPNMSINWIFQLSFHYYILIHDMGKGVNSR